jgi:hypothetical protein
MKRLLVVPAMMILVSCQSEQRTISESRRDAIIDSLVAMRMEEVTRQATEDLDRRRSIEVKAKADSIVNTMTGASTPAPPDNTVPNNLPMP